MLRFHKRELRLCIANNIDSVFCFIWLNGSIDLIRPETETYDIVRFSRVINKSLALGSGRVVGDKSIRNKQNCKGNLTLAKPFFSGDKTGYTQVCRQCNVTLPSGNLDKTSLREKCRGAYRVPRGKVFSSYLMTFCLRKT